MITHFFQQDQLMGRFYSLCHEASLLTPYHYDYLAYHSRFVTPYCSASHRSVKVWDMRKNYSCLKTEAVAKHVFPYPGASIRSHGMSPQTQVSAMAAKKSNCIPSVIATVSFSGYSCLVLDSTRTRLFASCMDNTIYQFDCATFSSQPG